MIVYATKVSVKKAIAGVLVIGAVVLGVTALMPKAAETVDAQAAAGEVDQAYNAIQLGQGLDLTPYQGKRATLYTYELLEYPTGQEGVVANLLVRRNRLIAADISAPEADGFVHGITEMPE